MTYLQHARHSLKFSGKFAKASLQSFVHAFVPYKFERSTSDLIQSLNREPIIANPHKTQDTPKTQPIKKYI